MHMDPLLPRLTLSLAVLLTLAFVLRRLRLPAPVVYLLAGVLLGPEVLDLFEDREGLARIGEYGVLLLLFFLGTEISLPDLIAEWRVPVIGTLSQIALSLVVAAVAGTILDWSVARIVLLGFVISLSSTALVLDLLRVRAEGGTPTGRDVVSILLAQDLAVAPMLVVLGLLGGQQPTVGALALQIGGAVLLFALVAWVGLRGALRLPLARLLRDDPELQVFGALLGALVLATLSGATGLSTAFGAFVGGLVVGASGEAAWVHRSLDPLRVLLMAVFLMAIGAMVDLSYFLAHVDAIILLALAALLVNTLVNAVALLAHRRPWRRALYGGAMLAQIGEFSFVLAAVGVQAAIITDEGYQMVISVIATTLVLGTAWVALIVRLTGGLPPLPVAGPPGQPDPGAPPGPDGVPSLGSQERA